MGKIQQVSDPTGTYGFAYDNTGRLIGTTKQTVAAMTSEETRFFKLVDEYSRERYRCFLAEMFPDRGQKEYTLCLRPIDRSPESLGRSDCRYFHIDALEVRTAGQSEVLGTSITERLDPILTNLVSDSR